MYLDRKGLLAAWREGLLAQKVLEGKTKGYKRHPQLIRFRESGEPLKVIGMFLLDIASEARHRSYSFDDKKIIHKNGCKKIKVSTGQIEYEWFLLREKIKTRDRSWYEQIKNIQYPGLNRIFIRTEGGIASWEKVTEK